MNTTVETKPATEDRAETRRLLWEVGSAIRCEQELIERTSALSEAVAQRIREQIEDKGDYVLLRLADMLAEHAGDVRHLNEAETALTALSALLPEPTVREVAA